MTSLPLQCCPGGAMKALVKYLSHHLISTQLAQQVKAAQTKITSTATLYNAAEQLVLQQRTTFSASAGAGDPVPYSGVGRNPNSNSAL